MPAPTRRRLLLASLAAPLLVTPTLGAGCSSGRREAGGGPTTSSAPSTTRNGTGVAPEPTAALITRWAADPWSLGSYTYLAVGATPQDRRTLAEPLGRLVLAGEATSVDHPSTISTAT